MQIHLVVPGLVWPAVSAIGPASGLELPALAWLLGMGKRLLAPFAPLDHEFARLLGYPHANSDTDPLPLAALRRLGEPSATPPEPDSHWLCADPVNLAFARDHLLLNEFPAGELPANDAASLIAALNETFGDLGHFEAYAPTRWYLRVAAPPRVRLFPLHDVVGRPVRDFLPEGDDARLWQRTMNETQVLLHNHPVNQAREAAGLRPANSLWFWGAGTLRAGIASPAAAVQSTEPLTRGLARAGFIDCNVPDCHEALKQDTLVILDQLLKPSLQLDIDVWRKELATLEHAWFAPVAEALRRKRLRTLKLTAPGDRGTLEVVVQAADAWKFWRKPLPFDALLKALAPAPAIRPAHTHDSPPGNPAR